MNEIDKELLEKSTRSIELLESFYPDVMREDSIKAPADIHIQILAFENIVDICQEAVFESSMEEVKASLENVYHLDLLSNGVHVQKKLEEIETRFLGQTRHQEAFDLKRLERCSDDLHLIQSIHHALKLRIKQLHHEPFWKVWRNKPWYKAYDALLERLKNIETNIYQEYEYVSSVLSEHILENFAYIYTFYAYSLKYCIAVNKDIYTIEILSSMQKFHLALQPLSAKRKLQTDNLKKSYASYALQLLAESVEHYFNPSSTKVQ